MGGGTCPWPPMVQAGTAESSRTSRTRVLVSIWADCPFINKDPPLIGLFLNKQIQSQPAMWAVDRSLLHIPTNETPQKLTYLVLALSIKWTRAGEQGRRAAMLD